MFIHVIRRGDTIQLLSREYNVPISKIIRDNALVDVNHLVVGQSLIIKPNNFIYTVKPGDNLYEIANRYKVSVQDILDANPQITNQANLSIGEEIRIVYDNPDKVAMEINGFVYPTISVEVLRQTLPHLTYISIFSYIVRKDGTLVDIDDDRIIREAYRYNVVPLMTVTNISSETSGEFSTDLVHQILSNQALRSGLIENILKKMQDKDYLGVVFDFEYLNPEDRELYNQLLMDAKNRYDDFGFVVMTAVAPKISADQEGLLYEAHDYPAHGKYTDRVIIMTYEWGYLFGPALPVAPINEVEKVLSYTVTAIPANKILMGVPNYGYNFNVPFVEGTSAQLISNNEAIEIAIDQNAQILFNTLAQSPYFTYYENNQKHEVHFEDARSITAKVKLAMKYGLKGLSYWTLNEYFPPNWLIIDYYINVIKII
jgi:spore germination protein